MNDCKHVGKFYAEHIDIAGFGLASLIRCSECKTAIGAVNNNSNELKKINEELGEIHSAIRIIRSKV